MLVLTGAAQLLPALALIVTGSLGRATRVDEACTIPVPNCGIWIKVSLAWLLSWMVFLVRVVLAPIRP